MRANVVPHDPAWASAFEAEAQVLRTALGKILLEVHHIGSTAIPGILAKPIIDLLGVVQDLDEIDTRASALCTCGYEGMGSFGIDRRRYFRKNSAAGVRTHQLHVFASGSPHIERHLAFRDYLRKFPDTASAYSDLKARLVRGGQTSWDAYIDGKDAFVKATEAEAVAYFRQ